jgi:hypothetical protein
MIFRTYGPMHPAEAALCLVGGAAAYSAWLTHIVSCASDKLWGFLVVGALVFPVGIVHGLGSWLGLW